MQIQAIKVQRLYLQVAQQLQDLVSAGKFAVGTRLPAERDLAAIREAMIALEIAGLVEVRSGSGVYVQAVNVKPSKLNMGEAPGPFEILEARKLIEGETCALAAQRISDEQLHMLQQLLDEMAEENRREEITEQADEMFHCQIAQAAGNSALTVAVTWLWQMRRESAISTHFHQRLRKEGSRPILADHQAIMDALRARDSEAARAAMAGHLQRVTDHLLEVL